MAKEWAKAFYNSDAWIACKEAYISERIAIDGGMCEICREQEGYIVHHYRTHLNAHNVNDPMVTLNPDNLQYVCKTCHDWEPGHFYESHGVSRPRCYFNSQGNPCER